MADGKSRSTKDKEMAARLKREGDERWSGRCPICYAMVKNVAMYSHISAHSRGARA